MAETKNLVVFTGFGKKETYRIPTKEIRKAPWIMWLHRGWSTNDIPQNTIPSFQHGLENGYNHSEIDLRFTADKQIILSHDATLTGTSTDGTEKTITVANVDLGEVKDLTLQKSARFGDIKAPTLAEVLEFGRYTDMYFRFDIKTFPARDMLIAAAREVAAAGMQGHVTYADVGEDTQLIKDVIAIDNLARFAPTVPGGNYAAVVTAVGGDGQRLEVGFDVTSPTLAEDCKAARAQGVSTYLYPLTEKNYIPGLDTLPDHLEVQSGKESALFPLIDEYVVNKNLW